MPRTFGRSAASRAITFQLSSRLPSFTNTISYPPIGSRTACRRLESASSVDALLKTGTITESSVTGAYSIHGRRTGPRKRRYGNATTMTDLAFKRRAALIAAVAALHGLVYVP